MTNKTCFHCGKLIEDPLDYNLVPLDIPYVNLFFHKSCFREQGGYSEMPLYCSQRAKMIFKYKENGSNEQKRKRIKV